MSKFMDDIEKDLRLNSRSGLPEPLRVLVKEYPADIWESHENFEGLVRFWLDRHVMFRKLLQMMQNDLHGLVVKDMDPEQYRQRLARLGSMFVGELHMHHSIEDHQYFPRLQKLDPRLEKGFEILDTDHHALDEHLNSLTDVANLLLQSNPDSLSKETARMQDNLLIMNRFLDRHLQDEEELIVPVILKHGFRG